MTARRIRLGRNVACALYRHPVITARLAADLDNLSNERLVLGIGNVWDDNEFANLGMPLPPVRERQAAREEAVAIIRDVWGEAPFTFEGRHFRTGWTITALDRDARRRRRGDDPVVGDRDRAAHGGLGHKALRGRRFAPGRRRC